MYVSYIFDEDGVMYSDTYFGDYPHLFSRPGFATDDKRWFPGWMLLSWQTREGFFAIGKLSGGKCDGRELETFWVAGKMTISNGWR